MKIAQEDLTERIPRKPAGLRFNVQTFLLASGWTQQREGAKPPGPPARKSRQSGNPRVDLSRAAYLCRRRRLLSLVAQGWRDGGCPSGIGWTRVITVEHLRRKG